MAYIEYMDPAFEQALKKVPDQTSRECDLVFEIVKRIHDILVRKGWSQADLARATGKSEAEISRWMSGSHNFTVKSIALIETALNERILSVNKFRKPSEMVSGYRVSPRKAAFLSEAEVKYGKGL